MTDLEMTKLCAESMGLTVRVFSNNRPEHTIRVRHWETGVVENYWPITDDAQCFALVKKFRLNIGQLSTGMCKVFTSEMKHEADDGDLSYAIVECVAKMQAEKARTASDKSD